MAEFTVDTFLEALLLHLVFLAYFTLHVRITRLICNGCEKGSSRQKIIYPPNHISGIGKSCILG